MVRGRGLAAKEGDVLSPAEVSDLQDQKRELEAALKDAGEFGKGSAAEGIDQDAIKRQIRRIDMILACQPKLTESERDKAEKRLKEIEEKVVVGMPTRYEMDFPHKNPGAVRKNLDWCRRNDPLLREHKKLKTMLGDHGRSVEALRKER